MKLAVVGPVYPYRGGIAHYTTRLGLTLQEKGHEVMMVSFSRQYPAFLYPGKSDKDPSQEHASIAAHYLLDPLYPWTWWRAARAISAWEPEMVLVQWWTTFWGPALLTLSQLLRARGLKVVFNIHNVMPHEQRFFDRWMAQAVLAQGAVCVPLSAREEQRLRDLLPEMVIFPSRLPAHQVVELRLQKAEARRRLGLSPETPVVLMFGIVRPYKGLNVLLDALGILQQEGVKPTLLVAGEFWQNESLYRTQITQMGLEAQVRLDNHFIPNEALGIYFSAADVYAAPYLGGTQSGAIRAALEFGLPVLASDRISADLPMSGCAVKVHPAGDAQKLAQDLRLALEGGLPQAGERVERMDEGWDDLLSTLQTVRDTLCSKK